MTASNLNKIKKLSIPILCILILLFLFSVFKNISYPLFWADESMTVVGGERTLFYGYPKVHDGKNVLYDLRHPIKNLGINEKYDAFVGNANWGMYYIAALGVKVAEYFDDIYIKTGIIRSVFAALGVVGILVFGINSMLFLSGFHQRISFLIIYFLLVLLSVSLTLHVREARYYSILLLCSATIIFLFTTHHLLNKIPYWIYSLLITLNLGFLFFSFSPAFFVFYFDLALFLGTGWVFRLYINHKAGMGFTNNLKIIGFEVVKYAGPYLIGLVALISLMRFFKTFQIAEELAKYNGYGTEMYLSNLATIWSYFSHYDHIYLAIILKAITLVLMPRILNDHENLLKFKMSSFLTIFIVCYIFLVATMPNYIFIRYFVNIQPVLLCTVLLDMFILYSVMQEEFSGSIILKTTSGLVIALIMLNSILKNRESIFGHCYELTHRYKGCIDYVIEYIKLNVKHPEDLIISTNYEETSFMYYLKSKVIIGFVKNNLEEDLKYQPDIVIYRRGWGWQEDQEIFMSQLQKVEYIPIYFPIADYPVNNIPEINEEKQAVIHQFKTLTPVGNDERLIMYVRKDKANIFPLPKYNKYGEMF